MLSSASKHHPVYYFYYGPFRFRCCSMIKFPSENGGEEERVRGKVFVWNGESEELREGNQAS
jgi:hypothetical protein